MPQEKGKNCKDCEYFEKYKKPKHWIGYGYCVVAGRIHPKFQTVCDCYERRVD